MGVSPDTEEHRTRLRYLLDAATTELPGAVVKAARDPGQARPLPAPTPEVAQLEALRELKAASQRVGLRHAQENGVSRWNAQGQLVTTPLLKYVQGNVMANPLALTAQSTLDELKKPYVQIATSKTPQYADKDMLLRYSQALKQAVQAFLPQLKSQQSVQAVKQAEPPAPAQQQKTPTPKRRGPKL